VLWTGFAPKVIPYRREVRQGGRSRWTFAKKVTYLLDGALSYSYRPLRLMSLLGLFFGTCGLLYASLIAVLRLTGALPQIGILPPLMVAVLVLGGTQMLMLGIIGEYIWRTLAQARNRPLYVVDRVFEYSDVRMPASESPGGPGPSRLEEPTD